MPTRFPKDIFVTVDANDEANDEEKDLLVWREIQDGIEDCGPTRVAHYRLIEVKQIVLRVNEI